MASPSLRKIAAPSFTVSDIYGGHRVLLALGLAVCLIASCLIIGGGLVFREASQIAAQMSAAKGVSALMNKNLAQMSAGADSLIPSLVQSTIIVGRGIPRQPSALLSLAGSAAAAGASDFARTWWGLQDSMSTWVPASESIERVHQNLANNANEINQLAQRSNALWNAQPAVVAQYNFTLTRLFAYSETTMGPHSLPAIASDVALLGDLAKKLVSAAASDESRSLSADTNIFMARLLPDLTPANIQVPPKDALTSVVSAANALNTALVSAEPALSDAIQLTLRVTAAGCVLLLVGLGILLIGGFKVMQDFTARFRRATAQVRQNDVAVDILADELREIAEGNINLTLTEIKDEKLSGIADGANGVVLALRNAIMDMRATSATLTERAIATSGSVSTATRAANEQSMSLGETKKTLKTVADMVHAIQIDTQSSNFAANSAVDAALDGNHAMLNSIQNMDEIRETIQETAKHIKRVGERSQEINEVIEILTMFTEKIKILGLNASLEAERAGEKGRGFAVVANEVKIMGTQAAESLTKIAGLVQNMQADTRAAIAAMERSTAKVVSGAYTAEHAGASLEVIRTVVEGMAALANSIVAATMEQSRRTDIAYKWVMAAIACSEDLSEALAITGDKVKTLGESAMNLQPTSI